MHPQRETAVFNDYCHGQKQVTQRDLGEIFAFSFVSLALDTLACLADILLGKILNENQKCSMDNNNSMTITGPYGRFTRKENGLIYFYKANDIAIDKSMAVQFLEIIRDLDDSGAARVIVVQGHGVEYSFQAQRLLLTSNLIENLAYVIQTSTQMHTIEVLQDVAKIFKSKYRVKTFSYVEEAEAWMLGG